MTKYGVYDLELNRIGTIHAPNFETAEERAKLKWDEFILLED